VSDISQGQGWWQASDGKWYAPSQLPAAWSTPPPAAPPGYGYYQYGTAAAQTNGYAIASLVLGIVWIWAIGSILALIFGYKAKAEIDRSYGRQSGRGMAIAGIVLGWIGVVGTALLFALVIAVGDDMEGYNSDPVDGFCNESRYWQDPDCG
jgi:Domain of unknown function (DUF4190)